MSDATIEGKIPSAGYLHVIYHNQWVDGALYTLYDIVITPKDENGNVSFTLPQGISASIALYEAMNGRKLIEKAVTIPKTEKVILKIISDLVVEPLV